MQLAVHTVQRNWISRLGRYLMPYLSQQHSIWGITCVASSHALQETFEASSKVAL